MARVTQSEIARRLGVSRQVVGCALGLYNGSNIKLPPETIQKIQKLAKELGYRPNRLAQIINGRKSGVIGVLNCAAMSGNSMKADYYLGQEIFASKFHLMLYNFAWFRQEGITSAIHTFIDHRVEGVILVHPADWLPPEMVKCLQDEGIPVVSYMGVLYEGVPHICADETYAVYEMVSGLIQRGYETMTFLTCWPSENHEEAISWPIIRRVRGFTEAILDAGGLISRSPVDCPGKGIQGEVVYAERTEDWVDPYIMGYLAAQKVLSRPVLPEVLLCGNDDWALGALRACKEAGLRVPEDIALTGNDDIVPVSYGYIPVTTTAQPVQKLMNLAVDTLKRMIAGEPLQLQDYRQKIRGEVVWRHSTERRHKSGTHVPHASPPR